MTTFTFDGVSSTTIPELEVLRVRRPLVAGRRDDFVSVPGREGFWLFTERPGSRMISLELHVLGDTFADRRAAVIAVADLLDAPEGLARLVVDDEPDRFHLCRLGSNPDPEEWLSSGRFSVDMIAEPFAQAITPSVESLTLTSATPATFTIPDKVYGIPEIELTATGGTVTAFTLEVNGLALTYAAPSLGLTAGQILTVSTVGYTVTRGASIDPDLVGTFDPDDLDMGGVSGDFGYLVPGLNTVEVTRTGTAGTIAATIRWRERSR